MRAKKLPLTTGIGELRFLGFNGPVAWRLEGDLAGLRPGPLRLKGAITANAEVALAAFRAGEGVLVLESGDRYRLTMVGHSAGDDEVYVECRI